MLLFHVHMVPDTHVYLEAVVALYCKLSHVRAGAEVDFSVEVISLQAQTPTRTSVQTQLEKALITCWHSN